MGPTHNRSCPDQELQAWERALLDQHDKEQVLASRKRIASKALLNLFKISDDLNSGDVLAMLRKIEALSA